MSIKLDDGVCVDSDSVGWYGDMVRIFQVFHDTFWRTET